MLRYAMTMLLVSNPVASAERYPAPMEAEIADERAGCVRDGGRLTLSPDAVELADFDGDAKPDYLLRMEGLRCSAMHSNEFCGSAGCMIDVFLSSQGFQPRGGFYGIAKIDRARSPVHVLITDRAGTTRYAWTGRKFERAVAAPVRAAPVRVVPAAPAPIVVPLRLGHWVGDHETCSAPTVVYRYDGVALWVRGTRTPSYSRMQFAGVRKLGTGHYKLLDPRTNPDGLDESAELVIHSLGKATLDFVDNIPLHWCAPETLPARYR